MTDARDFIENYLLPFAKQFSAWKQVPEFIESYRHKWDKPEQGVVDEEAFKQAKYAARGEGWPSDHQRFLALIQAYEQAKLDKLTGKAYSAKPSAIGEAWQEFKAINDKRLEELERASCRLDKATVEELPPLPVKITQEFWNSVDYSWYINQLIDCIAALYKRDSNN